MRTFIWAAEAKNKLPKSPGVYLFKNPSGRVLYVGKAVNLANRVGSYFGIQLMTKTSQMMGQVKRVSIIETENEVAAFLLEAELVRKFKPKYNIQLKDDKSPLYVGITREAFPRVLLLRRTHLTLNELSGTFGPYSQVQKIGFVLRFLRRAFPYATHKPGKRPCLESQIGLCRPCPNEASASRTEYLRNIRNLKAVLRGKSVSVQRTLRRQMENMAREEKFEEAKEIQIKLELLSRLGGRGTDANEYLTNPNLKEDLRGQETESLEAILKPFFGEIRLKRIEAFDISHTQGSHPTASMVTFIGGEPAKKYYRHFKMGSSVDTEAMAEVLQRRSKYFTKWGKPDLILLDGGKPQLTSAAKIGLKVPYIGLAKSDERIIVRKTDGSFVEIPFRGTAGFRLLQRLRDEAHRFSRRLHQKLIRNDILKK